METLQSLDGTWAFAPADAGRALAPTSGWRPARVPGNVHSDLMAVGALADPLVGDQERTCAWVEERDWWYRREFKADARLLEKESVRLVADGLDTWCTLWLNGRRLGSTQDMFVEHSFDVRRWLRPGDNTLLLRFESPKTAVRRLEGRYGFRAAVGGQGRTHARKAAYSFGWDWAPRVATSGAFRGMRLEGVDGVRVTDVWVRTLEAAPARAAGEVRVEVETGRAVRTTVRARVGAWEGSRRASLRPGRTVLTFRWTLDRPELWWPQGWGEAALVPAQGRVDGGSERTVQVGLRTVALDRRRDADGASFGFVVNGRRVFAKGANWIPVDSLLGRVPAGRAERLLELAAQGNYTLVRVWGGGLYESEEFYGACDRLGLMVWQDFPFACGEYPEHPEFLALVEAEGTAALRRLRRHPSLVLLCGGNENHAARHQHWFAGREAAQWGRALTHRVLPRLCAREAPGVPYWNDSPYGGKDPNGQGEGDRHHWDVWAGYKEIEHYRTDRSRFVSEFGVAALPGPAALRACCGPGTVAQRRAGLRNHDKVGPRGGEGIPRLAYYLSGRLPSALDLEGFRYLTQVLQAQAMGVALEHWRRLKPHTQGAVVWQHNDCWPSISWSLIDSDDLPKLAYFAVRAAFDPLLLSGIESAGEGGTDCAFWLTSDGPAAVRGTLRVERWTTSGKRTPLGTFPAAVAANSSRAVWRRTRRACGITDPASEFLAAHFHGADGLRRRGLLFFGRPAELALQASRCTARGAVRDGRLRVRVSSPGLALACEVTASVPGRFSDNGFDLLAGEHREVDFHPLKPPRRAVTFRVRTLHPDSSPGPREF